MKRILTLWLRLNFELVYRFGYCVDVETGFQKVYAAEPKDVKVVGVFD